MHSRSQGTGAAPGAGISPLLTSVPCPRQAGDPTQRGRNAGRNPAAPVIPYTCSSRQEGLRTGLVGVCSVSWWVSFLYITGRFLPHEFSPRGISGPPPCSHAGNTPQACHPAPGSCERAGSVLAAQDGAKDCAFLSLPGEAGCWSGNRI